MAERYRTVRVAPNDAGVLNVVIDAPPMNLIGPELVRDFVTLIGELESGGDVRVLVLESADPEYFIAHVDLTKVAEYSAETAKAVGSDDASLGMLWRTWSELPVVTIAKLRGRVRGAGSELALACDMRFAARENAILGQPERLRDGTGYGSGAVQHLTRLLGRRSGRLRLLARAEDRVVPRRRGARRRLTVPPPRRSRYLERAYRSTVRAGAADPRPARTQPR